MASESEFHFFTGENGYALQVDLQRWKEAFAKKHGSENFLQIEGSQTSLSPLLDAVSVMPFIAEKRLIVIQGLPKIDRDECKALAESIHPQTVVVVVEGTPDKRFGITKEILALATVHEYNPLAPRELLRWAQDLLAARQSSIAPDAFLSLVSFVGSDQWVLESELKKLSDYAQGEILPAHIEALAVPAGEQVIWRLTDLIGGRKADEALLFLRSRMERGEDPYGLWVILLNMVKNLMLVWAGLDAGLRDERSIASAFGMHFLSVRGLMPLARSLTRESIDALVTFVSASDLGLKTGVYHYTSERQSEVVALTERTILMCR